MKLKAWLLSALAPLTAVSVLAQASNSVPPALTPPPPVPATAPAAAPGTNAPAAPAPKRAKASKPKAKHKKTAHAKSAAKAKSESKAKSETNSAAFFNPPLTATVKCTVLDVRGHGSFAGEVITHVKKGETVSVLENITLAHVHSNEPSHWSRILMPSNTPVWVDADFIDPGSKAVRVKRVNVRGGPGENYSVVARLDQGTVVKDIRKQQGWLEIETPTNAYAFVATEYLEVQPAGTTPPPELAATPVPTAPPAPAVVPAPAQPEPTPAPSPAPQTVVVNVPTETAPPAPAKPVEAAPAAPVAPAPTPASQSEQELAALHKAAAPEPPVAPPAATPAPAPTPVPPEAAKQENPETPRIVTREGFVHRARNIQAPSGFELHDIKSGELIEYLQPAPEQKKFKIFVGTRVRITGPEFLDPAWPRTPILHVQTVDLLP